MRQTQTTNAIHTGTGDQRNTFTVSRATPASTQCKATEARIAHCVSPAPRNAPPKIRDVEVGEQVNGSQA